MPIKVYLRDYLSAGHPDWPNLLTIDNIDLCGIDPLDMEIGYKFSVLYPLGGKYVDMIVRVVGVYSDTVMVERVDRNDQIDDILN
jgi:hypothetical protein